MIAVVCGTKEGREIISYLTKKNYKCLALVTTGYGKQLAEGEGVEVISAGAANKVREAFEGRFIKAVVDSSHPYATDVSKKVSEVCDERKIPYIRFWREETDLPENSLVHVVASWQEAADCACRLGETIFLTTGSHNLKEFLELVGDRKKRIVIRVLPDSKIIEKCQELGFPPRDIVAMQGPFSKQMNKQTYKMFNTDVVITKDSGKAGGTDTKITAALELKIPVVVLRRPLIQHGISARTYEEVFDFIKNNC